MSLLKYAYGIWDYAIEHNSFNPDTFIHTLASHAVMCNLRGIRSIILYNPRSLAAIDMGHIANALEARLQPHRAWVFTHYIRGGMPTQQLIDKATQHDDTLLMRAIIDVMPIIEQVVMPSPNLWITHLSAIKHAYTANPVSASLHVARAGSPLLHMSLVAHWVDICRAHQMPVPTRALVERGYWCAGEMPCDDMHDAWQLLLDHGMPLRHFEAYPPAAQFVRQMRGTITAINLIPELTGGPNTIVLGMLGLDKN